MKARLRLSYCFATCIALCSGGESWAAPAGLPSSKLPRTEWTGRSLAPLLDRWSSETRLRLEAAPRLASQKITLRLQGPDDTRRVLPALATLLQAEWRQEERGGKPVWHLRRLPKVQADLDRERARRERLETETRKQQSRLMRVAMTRAADEVSRPPRDLGGGIFGRPYINPEAEPLVSLIGTLSPAQQQYLAANPRLSTQVDANAWVPDNTPVLSAPYASLSPSQQGYVTQFLGSRGITSDPATGVVEIYNRDGTNISVAISFSDGSKAGDLALISDEGGAYRKLRGPDNARGEAPESESAPYPPSRASQVMDPLERLNRLRPKLVSTDWTELDYADAIKRTSELLAVSIAADYYTLRSRITLKLNQAKASELVESVMRAFGCAVRWEGDVLLLRSKRWTFLDEREIAEALLVHWVAAKRREAPGTPLDLAQFASISSALSRTQVSCLADFVSREQPSVSFAQEAEVIRQEKELLDFCGVVGPGALAKLREGGLLVNTTAGRARAAAVSVMQQRASWALQAPAWSQLTLHLAAEAASPGFYVLELLERPGSGTPLFRQRTAVPAR